MEDGLTEELHFHLENETEKNVAAGMNPEEARYAALRTFGEDPRAYRLNQEISERR